MAQAHDGDVESNAAITTTAKNDKKKKLPTASFLSLFRFASSVDILILSLGILFCIAMSATLPGINIVFGDMIDSIASPLETQEVMRTALFGMVYLSIYGFVTFFLGYSLCGWAASRIANGFRGRFLEAVLRQDATFFDHAERGSLTLMLSDAAYDIQSGLADKFAGMLQGIFQFAFGFGIAFYYGPLLSLVLLACTPVLAGIMTLLILWGSEDGLLGKEAYEMASGIATEALSNVRTVFSLNIETEMSNRYDARLKESEVAAVSQARKVCLLSSLLFGVMFVMYGIGFYYGAVLIADSTDNAIADHPAPEAFLNGQSPYDSLYSNTTDKWCGAGGAGGNQYKLGSEAYEICACGLPWDLIAGLASGSPNCGCGFGGDITSNARFSTNKGCFTGGKTMLVFFSVLIGAFSAGQIGPGLKALNESRAAASKIINIIDRRPEIDVTAMDGKVRLDKGSVRGELVLEQMQFRYKPKDDDTTADGGTDSNASGTEQEETEHLEGRPVFGGCNLTIAAGQSVALVGESGCGKSTIAKLIQRFYDPTEGKILLDGVDLRDIAVSDLRANIGVVSQEPLLFDRSVRDNIRYGKPDASEEEIVSAAKSANAHSFIQNFPDGYDTMVGPGGSKLSGGQKQRVAIARAILRNPAILILDEATSALDNKSEKIVQQALSRLLTEDENSQRTTIIIAHRLSTVRNADKIVVLGSPEGTSTALTGSIILEEGSHDELMSIEGGFYKALVGAGGKSEDDDTSEISSSSLDLVALEDEFLTSPVKIGKDTDPKAGTKTSGGDSSWKEKLFGKKKDATEIAKVKEENQKLKLNKSRVWKYTKPEMPLIVIGSFASIVKGTLFPLLSLAFSEMIITWFVSDTDEMRKDSLKWSYFFYGLAAASFVFEFIQKYLFEKVGERLTKRLRSDTFRGMLRQDVTWFEDEANGVGVLSSRLATDVKYVRLVAGQGTASVLETVSALTTGIIISLTASWEIFLVMLAMVPILGVAEMLNMQALMGSEGSIRSEMTKSTNTLHETITGIREVQAFSMENMIVRDIKISLFDTIGPSSRKAAITKGFMMGIVQAVTFLVYAVAFWFGGEMIEAERITFADFNKALWAMAFAASGLGQAALFAGDTAKAAVALKAIFAILDHKSDINSNPWENDGLADPHVGSPVVRALSQGGLAHGTAKLSGVNFAYPTRKAAKIFDEIELSIPAGKVVALVGSSGSGKSSVIQLLQRFYDPISYKEEKKDGKTEMVVNNENGIVSIDGGNMKQLDCRWLRRSIGLVGQEPVLFNETVYNNIALGKEDCTKEDVEEAAKNANAYDFIMKLQDGFDTMVGNAGSKVSGGQKQRIAIARALVGRPKILLLDEATSALDNESEKIVQASLDALVKASGGDRTTIIIAHRLSTIRDADVICVLENNGDGSKVVEMGSHNELMELGQKYKALVEAYEKK